MFFAKLIKKVPATNDYNKTNIYKIKLKFHIYLLMLTGFSFFYFFSMLLNLVDKEYLLATLDLISVIFLYYFVSNEFNKLFKIVTSKNYKFKNKH